MKILRVIQLLEGFKPRTCAHITKDAYELQGKIINPAFNGAQSRSAGMPENRQKKGVAGEPRPNHH
jgi:hypothetical protein